VRWFEPPRIFARGRRGAARLEPGDILRLQAASATDTPANKTGWGQAKSVIMIFLQGGPSHIDIWDPKPDAPSNIRGEFKPIKSNVRAFGSAK
jgi:hypothetical protein